MRSLYLQLSNNNPNLTEPVGNQIAANPSIVPTNPFIEKYFAKVAEPVFSGKRHGELLVPDGVSQWPERHRYAESGGPA